MTTLKPTKGHLAARICARTSTRFGASVALAGLLLSLTMPTSGAIFRTVDAQGNITYTDQPPNARDTPVKSEQIEIATPNTFQDTTPYERWDPSAEEQQGDGVANYSLAIVSPSNDASIRNNAGNVVIETRISPDLAEGHVARIELDGSMTGEKVVSGAVYLTNVPRGTHSARLVVESAKGQRLAESPASVFHLQRISVFSPSKNSNAGS